jgi:signal transduction histidine kinase/CheY-like chemotaxis protein
MPKAAVSPHPADADNIGAEQVAALFAALPLGVLGAAAGASILAFALVRLDVMDWRLCFGWAGYIAFCAFLHLLLFRQYRRDPDHDRRWLHWAIWFAGIAVLEGVGWGLMPLAASVGNSFDIEMLTVVVTLGVAAGSIPAFSPYLPVFAVFFLPATVPYAVWSIAVATPLHQATALLMVVFIGAIFGLAVIANRSFSQLVRMRIRTAAMAEDLRRQKEIAEAASLSKSMFLAAASHDLRQPVHALGLFAGALRAIPMGAEGQRIVEQIETSAQAMDGLFAALLDISRLDAGTVDVRPCGFAVYPFLDRICRDHAEEARAKGIRIDPRRTNAIALSDPVLLERIVRNLVANAVRYTDRGRVVVGCRRRGDRVAIQVWDTGRGIPDDQIGRIFEEYYQIGNTERDRAKGLGLGLAIVRRLAGLLGCEISVRSKVGSGSCFEIAVPLSDRETLTPDVAEEKGQGALARSMVVVVDDELPIRQGMATLLGSWGHEVIAAASGDEAMRLLASHPRRPDLIICDYRLRNGENGIGVIETLQSEYNHPIPALLVTGDTAPDRLAEAHASGLLLLHKPVSNSKLRAVVANLARSVDDTAAATVD